jgi:hypothetical protein
LIRGLEEDDETVRGDTSRRHVGSRDSAIAVWTFGADKHKPRRRAPSGVKDLCYRGTGKAAMATD